MGGQSNFLVFRFLSNKSSYNSFVQKKEDIDRKKEKPLEPTTKIKDHNQPRILLMQYYREISHTYILETHKILVRNQDLEMGSRAGVKTIRDWELKRELKGEHYRQVFSFSPSF